MKVLVTGAGGYLGRGLIVPFEGRHELRLMDVLDWDTPHEKLVGSVADLDTVLRAVEGVDGIVIGHMASRRGGSYSTPVIPYDVNVKGTANLLFAAAEQGIRRISLISSIGVVRHYRNRGAFLARDLPLRAKGIYCQTKICQEVIARQYHYEHGIGIAAIRPAYITDADTLTDKYGKKARQCNWQFVDRRDIGEVARLALELPDLGFEIFYVLSTPMASKHADMENTYSRLNWKPKHDFSNLPRSGED